MAIFTIKAVVQTEVRTVVVADTQAEAEAIYEGRALPGPGDPYTELAPKPGTVAEWYRDVYLGDVE